MHSAALASGGGFDAPGPVEFQMPDIFGGNQVLLTKSSLLVVLAAIIVMGFFLAATGRRSLIPSKLQFVGESAYSFIRDGMGRDVIGERDFLKYVPLLVTAFFFILVNNLYGLIPFLQFSSFSRAGFAYSLAVLVWLTYIGVGIRRHGPLRFLKNQCVPSGVPKLVLILLIPLEFLSNLIVRPVTLSLRLFANMFAGHLLILLFSTGAAYLLTHEGNNIIQRVAGVAAFVLGLLVGFLEFIVALLQAYVFTLLTATYISTSLAAEH
jgi:F-type H+-transporting ATPase subunit a